ncbi:ankyrin repeat and SOCS box protein 18 isoform X2 [Phyllostomus hastatus]|uniref:ankyrin repeat and SOCS box protein 18 isoform X2 n=1 Tax=Phyllostomus hastatus TaxID=9423 RepID=UPI001E67F83D|nr:ankyrin repeat and SOCS box protein 18 isoform X2 [Phyllostomus hastatus]
MSGSDRLPDYPLGSGVARRLRSALEAGDDEALRDVVCTQVRPVDAVIELANDDWMKDPWAPLPPGVLLGDLRRLAPLTDRLVQGANAVLELRKEETEWRGGAPATFGLSGLWTLEYKRELTTPLCIAAARGHEDCVGHLLHRGADPDSSPGGRGPLHEACLGGHTACAELLLRHRADPDLLSAEGLAPLHLCRTAASLGCAQALLEHGASVHCAGGTGQDTPLHVAAQHGLDDHARLYLDRGARVDARNGRGETALSTACGAALQPDQQERGVRLCALLLQRGAAPDARDEDERSPLHKACSQARPDLAHLLLRHGADATALDYGGASPLGRVLQTAACAPQAAPERIVQALLNHGAPTVWPDAFPKVLKSCAAAPAIVEVLFNSYPQLRVPESWREAIPEEAFQVHRPFYQSLFAAARGPRRLQHLCRCAVRRRLGGRCSRLVPRLPLPETLRSYLLLEPEGVLR